MLLESAGTPIAGVANDFDDDTRHATAPDIGADEVLHAAGQPGHPGPGVHRSDERRLEDAGAGVPAGRELRQGPAGAQVEDARALPHLVGPAPAVTEIYNDTQTIPSISGSGGSATQLFAGVTIAAGGTYTMYARAEMPATFCPATTRSPACFEAPAPLCGSYLAGTGQPFDRLTTAIARLNQVGVPRGGVPVDRRQLFGRRDVSPGRSTPSPAAASRTRSSCCSCGPGATVAISRQLPDYLRAQKLNGADYVTIDGSNNGTTSRDLSVTNTSLLGSTATNARVASQGAGAGATNNTVRQSHHFRRRRPVGQHADHLRHPDLGRHRERVE